MKIPTTLNDIIKPSSDKFDSLSPSDRINFQHEAVLKMTEEEFKKLERGE
jgi:hypothetical protein